MQDLQRSPVINDVLLLRAASMTFLFFLRLLFFLPLPSAPPHPLSDSHNMCMHNGDTQAKCKVKPRVGELQRIVKQLIVRGLQALSNTAA